MKYKITIKNDNKILFDGHPLDLPIKQEMLIDKSVEMFDDKNPCIIHQTYVIESFIDALITRFKKHLNEDIKLSREIEEIKFIDIKNIESCIIQIRRK
jgi:rRNA-processing protein FCF1